MEEEKNLEGFDKYDLTFIVPEDQKSEVIEKAIVDSGSRILKIDDLGIKQFVYPIKKYSLGHYFVAHLEASAENLKKLADELKHEDPLIRYLLIKSLRFPEKRAPKEEVIKIETVKPEKPQDVTTKVSRVEAPKTKAEEAVMQEPAKKPVKPVKEEAKTAEVKKEKKSPARKKPAKISADELDKKLEELVED